LPDAPTEKRGGRGKVRSQKKKSVALISPVSRKMSFYGDAAIKGSSEKEERRKGRERRGGRRK